MRSRRTLLLVLATITLVAAVCGGSDNGGKGGSTPVSLAGKTNNHGTKSAKDGESLEVEADDFYFNPTFVKAPANAKIKIELKNEGTVPHTFTSDALHVDEQLNPGETKTIDATLPGTGSGEYHCKFHQGQGMRRAFAIA